MQKNYPRTRTESSEKARNTQKISEKEEKIARYFKFYGQNKNRNAKIPIDRLKVSTFIDKNKKTLRKLSFIFDKYKINVSKYVEFCVKELNINDICELLKIGNFVKFSAAMQTKEQYMKIFKEYNKTANNIADMCIRDGTTPRECIREMVNGNSLAYEYLTGRMSKYYIASIQNFKEIFERLDPINQNELGIIYDVSEQLNQEVQETFMMFKGQTVKPISYTEKLIKEKLTKQNQITN